MELEEQYDKIYRYCYFKTRHRQTAEDITQETFLRFFSQGSHLDRGKELPYLYTIARNLCIDEHRRPTEESLGSAAEPREPCQTGDWDESILLKAAISKLPKDEQEILLLRYANGVSITAICKTTGASRFAVYRKIARAVKFLKAELGKGGFSDGSKIEK